jgi:hypothetical protein
MPIPKESFWSKLRQILFVADCISHEAREYIKIDPEFKDKVLKEISKLPNGGYFNITLCNGETIELYVY